MLKKVLLLSMALLVGINTVNACEVEHKGANNKGEIITDFKPCMQDSCPIYKKYRELEIIIEIELQEKMSDEQVATKAARQDFIKANTRRIDKPTKIVYK